MGLNPRPVHETDNSSNEISIISINGKVGIAIKGPQASDVQAFAPMSPIKLIGMIQEAAGLESSDPDSWTYRTQVFEWAMEQSGGDVASALQVARFITDGDEAVR